MATPQPYLYVVPGTPSSRIAGFRFLMMAARRVPLPRGALRTSTATSLLNCVIRPPVRVAGNSGLTQRIEPAESIQRRLEGSVRTNAALFKAVFAVRQRIVCWQGAPGTNSRPAMREGAAAGLFLHYGALDLWWFVPPW
jgi:hypothetical protein